MKLKDIAIRNFRGIKSLELPLSDLTVLIGENNTGKSTVLEAIRLALTRGFVSRRGGQITEYDFHLADATATPQEADPLSITLHFAEDQENEWPDSIVQQLSEVIQLDSEGKNHIWLRVTGTYRAESASFDTKWDFLNANGVELNLKSTTPLSLLPRFVPLFFLSALRDASHEFGQRGQFWSSFLKSIQLPQDELEKIEQMLHQINTSVISANATLAQVTSRIADARRLVPLANNDPVVLEAIPTRVFDMSGRIQVHLRSSQGAKIPLYRHGEGTQSLAVLMLFQAFAAANLTESYMLESTPILALEEPEAHLHPSAIRALGTFMNQLIGQTIVTSHSGDLVSRVPLTSLRRLYKHNGETRVGLVVNGQFTSEELQAIDYTIRLARGHFLFSRCWLLVEGATEAHLIPMLFEIMGHSQDEVNVSILEFSQVVGKGELFIKLAKALGIEWFLMADGDQDGTDYVNRARGHVDQGEDIADRVLQLTHATIEHEFWHHGFDDFIENIVPASRRQRIAANAHKNSVEMTKLMIKAAIDVVGGKPSFAHVLANEIQRRGPSSIPTSVQSVIQRVVQLAGG